MPKKRNPTVVKDALADDRLQIVDRLSQIYNKVLHDPFPDQLNELLQKLDAETGKRQ